LSTCKLASGQPRKAHQSETSGQEGKNTPLYWQHLKLKKKETSKTSKDGNISIVVLSNNAIDFTLIYFVIKNA